MQLKIKRSQFEKGLLMKKVVYELDFRVEYTEEERATINSRNLGGELLFETDALRVTVKSIKDGHHFESQDLAAVAELEEVVHDACKNLKSHIQGADTFDGREGVIEI